MIFPISPSKKLSFQSYNAKFKEDILQLFYSNCPKYFDPIDEKELIDFLDNYADENYLVVLEGEKVIGCGGHYTKDRKHGIAWVFFERYVIGQKKLFHYADVFYKEIERRMTAEGHFYDVEIHTTQLLERFFNRYGFNTVEIKKDGFGEGLHAYTMKKILNPIA